MAPNQVENTEDNALIAVLTQWRTGASASSTSLVMPGSCQQTSVENAERELIQ